MAPPLKDVVLLGGRCAPILIEMPMEVLYKIIYKLSREDLFHWSLTCNHFSDRILPVLYKLDLGVEPFMGECEDTYGIYQSLEWACRYGFTGTFELARASGADLDHFLKLQTGLLLDPIFLSPLHVALFYHHEDLAELIIEAGADVTTLALHNGNYSAMHFGTSAPMVRRLLASGWSPKLHDLHAPYKSIIWWMLHRDADLGALQAALDAGVTISKDEAKFLMMHACKTHRLDVVRLLLSHGFRFHQQAVIKEDLGLGAPGICEQLCMTLALQSAIIDTCDAPTLTELVQLLLAEYEGSAHLDYRSEITWLILATGPDIPPAVRALLWDSLVVPRGLPRSSELADDWEEDSVDRITDAVHDVLLSNDAAAAALRDSNLRCILRSVGLCLSAEQGGFEWARVQPLVKTLVGESHSDIDVVCTYASPLTNPRLAERDEALTLELMAILLGNGADAEAKLLRDEDEDGYDEEGEEEEDCGADLLRRSMGMGAVRRVQLLLAYGASIDPPTWLEMEHPRMFWLDDVDAERLVEMVDAQREIVHMLTSRRNGFGKESTESSYS
ncbi:hypothetical protein F4811DRAFT_569044 [Daldinia bambusicola]|nr:hypothetical protein F4811DRAFT_569044 [Daldinia bambusicola]